MRHMRMTIDVAEGGFIVHVYEGANVEYKGVATTIDAALEAGKQELQMVMDRNTHVEAR